MEWLVYVLLGSAVGVAAAGIRIVRPVEKALVETFGRYTKTAESGFHWIIPVIQQMRKVNITENMVDVPPQRVITKDDLNAAVDAVVYFKVVDVKKALYSDDNYYAQITSLARTTLRDIIGRMTLSESNSKRALLNAELEKELDKHTDAWGIAIVRVELQRIEPPEDVQGAMNKVVVAEREKNAAVDFATAEETRADGDRRAAVKRAQGEAESIREVARARADEIEFVNSRAEQFFVGNAQLLKKLETAERALGEGSVYVVEKGKELVNVIGGVAGAPVLPPRKKKLPKKSVKKSGGGSDE